jgi:3-isopropylmalate dehydrogenase
MQALFLMLAVLVGTAAPFRMVGSGSSRLSSSLAMSVAAKSNYLVTLLPGDGIGPEILTATVPVLQAVAKKHGFEIKFQEADIGGIAIDKHNDPFPQATYDMCSTSDSVLLASIGGYKWDGNPRELRPESGLLKMRKSMGLFANLRPAKVIPQLMESSTIKPEFLEGVDIMVVRELTGGIYFGTPKGIETLPSGERRGYSTGCYLESEIERIAKVALEIAGKRKGKV